ncbi:MAG TPA: YIP1 family protein [Vicinamibacterales bacterium]|nr:YIP1 family protein [Vicinamibacterales bacterium]
MTSPSTTVGTSPAPTGLLSRFIGVITAPRATFQQVVAQPRWLGMLVLTTGIIVVCTAGPLFTESGRLAALDQQVRQTEAFGITVDDEMYTRMERNMRFAPYMTGGSILVATPIILVVMAGILFAVFNAALGGEASFKQLIAVLVHAGVISALGQLFTAPLNLMRGAMGSATNLAVLLPMIDEASFLGRLLGAIDLFIVWWLVVLAIGLGVLYRRRTQPIAISLFAVYAVIALAIAAVMSSLGG